MPTARPIFVLLYIVAVVVVWLALPSKIAAALLAVNAVVRSVLGQSPEGGHRNDGRGTAFKSKDLFRDRSERRLPSGCGLPAGQPLASRRLKYFTTCPLGSSAICAVAIQSDAVALPCAISAALSR
jgi:hypothetical protein